MNHKIAVTIASSAVALITSGCWGARPAVAPKYQRLAEPIVTGAFIVEPRTFKMFKIAVAEGMTNPRIEGTFSATGARNDIEVTLLDETQYAKWESRNRFEAAYQSGRVTTGTISLELAPVPATYYMVFSNRFSFLSNKAVTADVQLRYDRLDTSRTSRQRRGYSRY